MDEAPHDQAHDAERLIDDLIEREGGFVNHPADRGGATCFGITEAVARAHGYSGAMAMAKVEQRGEPLRRCASELSKLL